ncbi:hypothetical protein ABTF77_21125, partial [Acinetobacter baumannii]
FPAGIRPERCADRFDHILKFAREPLGRQTAPWLRFRLWDMPEYWRSKPASCLGNVKAAKSK